MRPSMRPISELHLETEEEKNDPARYLSVDGKWICYDRCGW